MTVIESYLEDALYCEEFELSKLLMPNEMVVNMDLLTELFDHINYLIERKKYYSEDRDYLADMESIQDKIKKIRLGSRS